MIEHFEQNSDPLKSINLYHVFRWIARAWPAITDTTIYRCFRKAKIINQDAIQLPAEPIISLESLYHEVRDSGQIQHIISIQNFLNPVGEDTPPADLTQADPINIEDIIAKHTSVVEEDIEPEGEDQTIATSIPSDREALEALRILERYQEH